MGMEFSITCKHCLRGFAFAERDADGLTDHIDDERGVARREGRDEAFNPDFADISDLRDNINGERPLRELAVAIARGDRAEAERLLDLVAAELGDEASEQVQQGRFSPEARRAV